MCAYFFVQVQTMAVGIEIVLYMRNGKVPGGCFKIQKVKEEASKVLGIDAFLILLWRKPPKMTFKNSIHFVTDRPFTADDGLM